MKNDNTLAFDFPKFYFDDYEWNMNYYRENGVWVSSDK